MRNEYDQADVARAIDKLISEIAGAFAKEREITIVGIRTRGETLAQRVTEGLKGRGFEKIGRGVLDITLYRDDLSEVGPKPMVRPTRIEGDISGKPLVLIDDVLFTGRSVRAGLDALSDFGRPSVVRLAVLVDRGGRELPIQADYVAIKAADVPWDHVVKVRLREVDGVDGIVVEPRK
jgi:pyrimidine operon attenuation protein/uracil phosphoribosyltransferase